jgi:hypothetical protein
MEYMESGIVNTWYIFAHRVIFIVQYRLDDQSLTLGKARFFSALHSNWLWGLPSGFQVYLLRGNVVMV